MGVLRCAMRLSRISTMVLVGSVVSTALLLSAQVSAAKAKSACAYVSTGAVKAAEHWTAPVTGTVTVLSGPSAGPKWAPSCGYREPSDETSGDVFVTVITASELAAHHERATTYYSEHAKQLHAYAVNVAHVGSKAFFVNEDTPVFLVLDGSSVILVNATGESDSKALALAAVKSLR
jgi:hypothetical protein